MNLDVRLHMEPGRSVPPGQFSGDTYTKGSFTSTLYDEDLVWADGYFSRWPQNWPQK